MWTNYRVVAADNLLIGKTNQVLKLLAQSILTVIKRVNAIEERKGQGRTFRFLNRRKEPYKWTDSVPEDDPEFQGLLDLLDDEEEAAYPEISAELPGVELEEEQRDFTPVTDEPEADF